MNKIILYLFLTLFFFQTTVIGQIINFETSQDYAFNFPYCISTGNFEIAQDSTNFKHALVTLGVFGFGGDIVQLDTVGDEVVLTGFLLYAQMQADSVAVFAFQKLNSGCDSWDCSYKEITTVQSISDKDGVFELSFPIGERIDGIFFKDMKGRVEETNAWLFQACD